MTREIVMLSEDASVADGLRLMSERGIHRLPVVDADGNLLGIVSDMDLRIAEAAGRLADPLGAVMTKRVVTVSEYCPLEDAAALMRRKGIGGLPVVRGKQIIGIITDGDIFDVFSQLLGVGRPGVRLTVGVPGPSSDMLRLLNELAERGGDIIGMGTLQDGNGRVAVVRVAGLSAADARQAAEVTGVDLLDLLEES
jgi:acetoin utilization protein AcuB